MGVEPWIGGVSLAGLLEMGPRTLDLTPGGRFQALLGLGNTHVQVCGKFGHNAGFVGSVYFDCPNKPCYLCGEPGHSTLTCRYRVSPGHGCSQAFGVGAEGSLLRSLRHRERDGR